MKKVLILGATSAIAQAVARLFAAEGAHLFLIGRHAERLEGVRRDLEVRGAARAEALAADLADLDALPALIDQAATRLEGIDAVLVAHGSLPDQATCQADAHQTLSALTVNFLSPVALLTAVAEVMEKQGRGTIAVIGSVAGDRGRQSNYVYGAAKGGLGTFVQGLRHRLARSGVAVTLVKPGFVDTPMTASFPKGGPLWATPERVARDIHRAMTARGVADSPAVLYTPWFWRWIMLVIRLLPDAIFRRTRL